MVSVSDMNPVSAKAENDIIDKVWGVVNNLREGISDSRDSV